MAPALLSLCMIAKNEAEVIGKALSSVAAVCDELLVLDTGSTDQTCLLAAKAGARVHHHVWQDDFAAARNASLNLAKGKYILVLDADECMTSADAALLRRLCEQGDLRRLSLLQTTYTTQAESVGFLPNNLNVEEAKGYPGFLEIPLVRLALNHPDLRFFGVIHERWEDNSAGPIQASGLRLHHYGKIRKAEQHLLAKRLLYRRLGEKKAALDSSFTSWLELGMQCWELKDFQDAETAFRKALSFLPDHPRALLGLAGLLADLGRVDEALQALGTVTGTVQEKLEARVLHTSLLTAKHQRREARIELEQLLREGVKDFRVHNNLAVLALAERRFDRALYHLEQASQLAGLQELILINQGLALIGLGRTGDLTVLADQYAQRGFPLDKALSIWKRERSQVQPEKGSS